MGNGLQRQGYVFSAAMVTGFALSFLMLPTPQGSPAAGSDGLCSYNISSDDAEIYRFPPNHVNKGGNPLVVSRTNDVGFREETWLSNFSGTPITIVIVGDSFTYGFGLNASDRYTDIVETRLKNRFDHEIEVINLGIPGSGMKEFYHILTRYGMKYEPDILVSQYHVEDELSFKRRNQLRKRITREYGQDSLKRPGEAMNALAELHQAYYTEVAWNSSALKNYGNAMKQLAQENDVQLLLYFLTGENIAQSPDHDFLRRNNAPIIPVWRNQCDVDVLFAPADLHQQEYKLPDGHPNAAGNRLLAQQLYPELASRVTQVIASRQEADGSAG